METCKQQTRRGHLISPRARPEPALGTFHRTHQARAAESQHTPRWARMVTNRCLRSWSSLDAPMLNASWHCTCTPFHSAHRYPHPMQIGEFAPPFSAQLFSPPSSLCACVCEHMRMRSTSARAVLGAITPGGPEVLHPALVTLTWVSRACRHFVLHEAGRHVVNQPH